MAYRLLVYLFFAAALMSPWGGAVFAVNDDDSPFQTGPTRTTNLGNIVHGADTQFIQFTNGFGVNTIDDVTWPQVIARRVINSIFSLLGIIAAVIMIYAGFLWLTAGGEEEKAKQGRTLLFQALIGLIIILSAYIVAYFVVDQLIKAIIR